MVSSLLAGVNSLPGRSGPVLKTVEHFQEIVPRNCFPLSSCRGTIPTIRSFITEYRSYFNFAVEQSEKQKRTSYTEDTVDALALEAEEGRGDRRNVLGELHASDDPEVSEWGNPSRVMSGDPLLNT